MGLGWLVCWLVGLGRFAGTSTNQPTNQQTLPLLHCKERENAGAIGQQQAFSRF